MFRDPNDPSKVNIIANYIGLEDPASGPELRPVRRRRPVRDPRRQQRRRARTTSRSSSASARRSRTRTRSSTTPFTIDPDDLRQPERQADVLGADDQGRQATTLATDVPDAAGEHRAALHAELRALHGRGDQVARRVAARCSPVSATTRSSSTSARCSTCSASDRSTAPTWRRCRTRTGVNSLATKSVHTIVAAAPDRVAHQERQRADHGDDQGVGHRRLRLEQPPAGQDPLDHRWRTELLGRVGPGQPARHPARQRGADPAGQEGQVERGRPQGRRAVLRQHPRPRADQAPAGRVPVGVQPEQHPAGWHRDTVPTWSSSSPVSSPGSPPPTRCRPPTSCGSTWRSRRCGARRRNRLAALQGDVGGFPNGRRLTDDVVDIELRVLAGELLDADGKINGTGGVPFSVLKRRREQPRPGHHRPVPLPRRLRGPATSSRRRLTT